MISCSLVRITVVKDEFGIDKLRFWCFIPPVTFALQPHMTFGFDFDRRFTWGNEEQKIIELLTIHSRGTVVDYYLSIALFCRQQAVQAAHCRCGYVHPAGQLAIRGGIGLR